VDLLELLNRQLREFDRAIGIALARHPDEGVFRSFPGVGTILSAMLLAEIGEDRARYPSADVLLAEAGLAPVTRSSGRTVRVRFRYAANASMREAFMWWAYNSIKSRPGAPPTTRRRAALSTTTERSEDLPLGGLESSGAAGRTRPPTIPIVIARPR
jgi:transposase